MYHGEYSLAGLNPEVLIYLVFAAIWLLGKGLEKLRNRAEDEHQEGARTKRTVAPSLEPDPLEEFLQELRGEKNQDGTSHREDTEYEASDWEKDQKPETPVTTSRPKIVLDNKPELVKPAAPPPVPLVDPNSLPDLGIGSIEDNDYAIKAIKEISEESHRHLSRASASAQTGLVKLMNIDMPALKLMSVKSGSSYRPTAPPKLSKPANFRKGLIAQIILEPPKAVQPSADFRFE